MIIKHYIGKNEWLARYGQKRREVGDASLRRKGCKRGLVDIEFPIQDRNKLDAGKQA